MEPERWDPVVPRVLSGTVRLADIPEIPQRVVRVFLSSTGVGKCEHVQCMYVRVNDVTMVHPIAHSVGSNLLPIGNSYRTQNGQN